MLKRKKAKQHYANVEFLRGLGAHCRRLRQQKGYSIDRLSKESDQLSTSVIHRLETGNGPVTVTALFRYAEVLELMPKQLLDFPFDYEGVHRERVPVFASTDRGVSKRAFKELLPLYSLKAAAGYFGRGEGVDIEGWVDARSVGKLDRKMFVVRAVGKSMEPKIRDGDLLVFRADPAGTRQGKIVLAQYQGPADPDTGGSYTVKRYSSVKKVSADGNWTHKQIVLSPLNRKFEPIVLNPKVEGEFRILAELVGSLGANETE
ncbi:MAG: LexA family transcriptional regulator [Deltaproteobacteria bacterium]|nr:LexA family transcriptional regulator [Deltaproteobacteria bacterium]